jgi:hypothetical protein
MSWKNQKGRNLLINSQRIKIKSKILDEYKNYSILPKQIKQDLKMKSSSKNALLVDADHKTVDKGSFSNHETTAEMVDNVSKEVQISNSLVTFTKDSENDSLIRIKESRKMAKPEWHAPWKLKTVIQWMILGN